MENNESLNENVYDKLIHFELVKRDNNSKIRNLMPAVVLAASIYYSSLLLLGVVAGYLASKLFSKYLVEHGKVDMIYVDFGKWKLHLHHWIMGAIFLLLVWFVDKIYLPTFFVGAVMGIIVHDIYDYNDWHKVLVKKEETSK